MMMGGHKVALELAALLSASALGYFVCLKANAEKKGSALKTTGLWLGSFIVILSVLASLLLAAKTAYICYLKKDYLCKGMPIARDMMGKCPMEGIGWPKR